MAAQKYSLAFAQKCKGKYTKVIFFFSCGTRLNIYLVEVKQADEKGMEISYKQKFWGNTKMMELLRWVAYYIFF